MNEPRKAGWAALLLVGLFSLLLASSATHDHFRHNAATAASCVFCGAAVAPQPPSPVLPSPPSPSSNLDLEASSTPTVAYLLQLDHSGGAPPTV